MCNLVHLSIKRLPPFEACERVCGVTFSIRHNTQKDVYRVNTRIPVFSPPSSKSLTFYK